MLTLSQFIHEYSGKSNVGDTEANKGQCVGLIEARLDNLGFARDHLWGNAKDLLDAAKSYPEIYAVILNTPTNFPSPGDVVVWDGTWGNGYGHTAVAATANANSLTVFEQNDPLGSPCHEGTHDYRGVMGWIHPKHPPAPRTAVAAAPGAETV